jgi:hypothetical protein
VASPSVSGALQSSRLTQSGGGGVLGGPGGSHHRVRAGHYYFFLQRQFLATGGAILFRRAAGPVQACRGMFSLGGMAEECPRAGGAEFWLPDEFLDDDFFSEEEKAAVAARSESDEEEGLGGLPRRVAGLLVGNGKGAGDDSSPAKVGFPFLLRRVLFGSFFGFRISRSADCYCFPLVAWQAEVMAGSPQSILCGLAASGEESPNGGASQVSSPPSSPLEQQPADPWDVLHQAAGQVARLRSDSIPVPKNAAAHHGHSVVPPTKQPAAPAPAPKAAGGDHYQPNNLLEQRRKVAQVRTSAMDYGDAQAFPH